MSAPRGSRAPWVARREGDRWCIYSPSEVEGNEIIVGYVEMSRPGFSHPMDRADALVMAAAPEMLSKLEGCLEMYDGTERTYEEAYEALFKNGASEFFESIRALLKKARGE